MAEITKQRILVTGANGFIGSNLSASLKEKGYFVRCAVRNNRHDVSGVDESIQVVDINESTDWQRALVGVDTVIHLAAHVHVMGNQATESLADFRKVNVAGTGHLARTAAKAGVKRFIFASSVKVNGEGGSQPYTENDKPLPQDAYGVSKKEAEDLLASIAAETGLQIVVLRLPLVYGPGVKANFKNLIKIINSGMPLPFKKINNRRSFIYLGNLIDAIILSVNHPLAAGQTFMISDGQDLSTPDLIKMIACAMNKHPVLFYLNPAILRILGKISGKAEEIDKLTGNLFVDSNKIKNLLGWNPPFSIEEGIRETVRNYKLP